MEEIKKEPIVYFELNNWFSGRDYPTDGKLNTWVETEQFDDDKWCRENKICVRCGYVDMSRNWCITATKDWVMRWCSELLEDTEGYDYELIHHQYGKDWVEKHHADYSDFLRYRDEFGDVWGRFGWTFLEYDESNFGANWYVEDEEEDEEDEA